MRQARGRLFAKVGAEGVYCVGVPGAELGIALKVEDGAARAVAPAILAVLRELDLISEDDFGALHSFAYAELLNTRGEVVGQVRPRRNAADARCLRREKDRGARWRGWRRRWARATAS
jgi:L-asparaginase II